MVENKKGQLGSTLSLFVSTILIALILIGFVLGAGVLKKVSGSEVALKVFNGDKVGIYTDGDFVDDYYVLVKDKVLLAKEDEKFEEKFYSGDFEETREYVYFSWNDKNSCYEVKIGTRDELGEYYGLIGYFKGGRFTEDAIFQSVKDGGFRGTSTTPSSEDRQFFNYETKGYINSYLAIRHGVDAIQKSYNSKGLKCIPNSYLTAEEIAKK